MKATDLLIEKHNKAIEILEAINGFEKRKELVNDSLNGFPGTFPELAKEYKNRLVVLDMCINRMQEKHIRLMESINNI